MFHVYSILTQLTYIIACLPPIIEFPSVTIHLIPSTHFSHPCHSFPPWEGHQSVLYTGVCFWFCLCIYFLVFCMSEIMVFVFLQISDLFHLIAPSPSLMLQMARFFFLMTEAFGIFIFNCGKYP